METFLIVFVIEFFNSKYIIKDKTKKYRQNTIFKIFTLKNIKHENKVIQKSILKIFININFKVFLLIS